jgi:N-terminal double-transmembrane domain
MWILGPIGFTAPWVLLALTLLPILWILLRAVPPAPIRRRFPGVALLLGLKDEEVEADRTPWWLLLLRMLTVAALIIAFAGPVLNPRVERGGSGPLLVLMDASWASAPDWTLRMGRVGQALDEAEADGRTVCILPASDIPAEGCAFLSAADWRPRLAGIKPAGFAPDMDALSGALATLPDGVETLWLSDGLARAGRDRILSLLQSHGPVSVFETGRTPLALGPLSLTDEGVSLPVLRAGNEPQDVTVIAHGTDPAGVARELARQAVSLGGPTTQVIFDLPPNCAPV